MLRSNNLPHSGPAGPAGRLKVRFEGVAEELYLQPAPRVNQDLEGEGFLPVRRACEIGSKMSIAARKKNWVVVIGRYIVDACVASRRVAGRCTAATCY